MQPFYLSSGVLQTWMQKPFFKHLAIKNQFVFFLQCTKAAFI